MAVTVENERALGGLVIGVDEAGRGPLAGGVFAAAVHVPFALAGDWKPGEFVTFWSATKAFNLAGLHAAVALCPDHGLRERVRAAQEVGGSGHLNAFGFVASATAWDCCADWLDELRAYLFGNYEAMIAFLRERMPAVKCTTLEATYLAWLDVSAFGLPSGELARRLEDEARVKFSPGSIYAEPKGGAFMRVNLASPRAMLMEALERVASWLPKSHGDSFSRRVA